MSRVIGLKDVYVAVVTSDTSTATPATVYATPIKLERSISAKITPKVSSLPFYSDDVLEEIATTFDSMDVEIGVNQLSLASRALLQGLTVVAGEISEGANDVAPEIAIGFRALKSNGKYNYVWLLKGKFEIVSDEYATKADKLDSKTPTLKGTFGPRLSDSKYRIMAEEETAGAPRIAAWFTSVPDPLPIS
jgi:phi13 family phage major tail protein